MEEINKKYQSTYDEAASVSALTLFFSSEEPIYNRDERAIAIARLTNKCVVINKERCSDMFKGCPAVWNVPVSFVVWPIEQKENKILLEVTCSKCGKKLKPIGNFYTDVKKSGGSIHGGGTESDQDQWLGTICTKCELIYCDNCLDSGGSTPCMKCGKPIVPAIRQYLPKNPKKLVIEKPISEKESTLKPPEKKKWWQFKDY